MTPGREVSLVFRPGVILVPEQTLGCYVLTDEGPRLALIPGEDIVSINPALFLMNEVVKIEVETPRRFDVVCALCVDANAHQEDMRLEFSCTLRSLYV